MKRLLTAVVSCCLFLMGSTAFADTYTKTKYPILLVHGVTGFDYLGGLIGYFHTIPYNLSRSGATVDVASVSFVNGSWERGVQLKNYINSLGYSKVNIMAHSQGAPTSRVAAHLNPSRIASITSIDGVNQGSKVADVLRGVIPPGSPVEGSANAIANALGGLINLLSGNNNPQNGIAALETLTTEGTRQLNEALGWKGVSQTYCSTKGEDVWYGSNKIKFFSWTGSSVVTNIFDLSDGFLAVTGLSFGGEANDGLVAACATKMGTVIGTHYSTNHIDAINHLFGIRSLWTNPVSLYRSQANRLKNKGL